MNPARRWLEIGLLFALWLFHSAGNLWWLKVDAPPFSDTAGHAITTLRVASWAWRQIAAEGRVLQTLAEIRPYPPLFYVTSLPFVWLISPSVDAMLVVNTLYFGLLIFSTYGIGRLVAGGRCGLLAAFLVSMYPILYGLSRLYLTDVALTAMTTFAIFCLFWSEAFHRRLPSLVLGVAIGLGVLTKWTFVIFLLGPLAIALYVALRHATRARLINIGAAGALALMIGLPWYLSNVESLQLFLQNNGFLAASLENDPAVLTVASFGFYLSELLNQQVLLPFFLSFVIGSFLALRRHRPDLNLLMVLAWFAFGYVASSLFINKDTRYTMPYLPALALLTAIGLVQIRQVMVRRVGLALIILYALVQYSGLTVGLSGRLAGMPQSIHWPRQQPFMTLYTESVHSAMPARNEDWQVDAIIKALRLDAEGRPAKESPVELLVVPTADFFDPQSFGYVKWRNRLPLDVTLVTGIVEINSASVLQRSDYVVTKSGNVGWDFALQDAKEITVQLFDPNSALRAEFELLAEFPLPDNSMAQLFRHNHKSPE